MAKLGQLILDNGKYGDKIIISGQYLSDMITPHIKLGKMFGYMGYGYLWYKPYDDREVYAAIGDGGNVIYVSKERNISAGVTGTFKPAIFDRVDFIEKYVLPVTEGCII